MPPGSGRDSGRHQAGSEDVAYVAMPGQCPDSAGGARSARIPAIRAPRASARRLRWVAAKGGPTMNHIRKTHGINSGLVGIAAMGLALCSCSYFAMKDQQDQMLANLARQQQEAKEKQAGLLKGSFQQNYDSNESSYSTMRGKLEMYEARYQDWLQEVTPVQKKSNEYASTTKTHDELKARVDKMEDEHGALVQWYEKTKESPTNDDANKLNHTYGTFSQRMQLYFSNYTDLNTRTQSISARKK
jgi:hypothetical protein